MYTRLRLHADLARRQPFELFLFRVRRGLRKESAVTETLWNTVE